MECPYCKRTLVGVTEPKDFELNGKSYTATHIPTATSEMWIVVISEVCNVYSIVLMDLTGKPIYWSNPPSKKYQNIIAKKIKELFF